MLFFGGGGNVRNMMLPARERCHSQRAYIFHFVAYVM